MEDKSKEIIKKVLDNLKCRGGFDGWWDNIDEDIQDEIIEELEQTVTNFLFLNK
jgi:hypothetical protein